MGTYTNTHIQNIIRESSKTDFVELTHARIDDVVRVVDCRDFKRLTHFNFFFFLHFLTDYFARTSLSILMSSLEFWALDILELTMKTVETGVFFAAREKD